MNAVNPLINERVQAQRERILGAAKRCFIEHGFHAASMAVIASTAQMSPGLIYRYFDSKNAIILAIIERQMEVSRAGIISLHRAPDVATAIFQSFEMWRSDHPGMMNASLFLEISAEARRDPKIAAAMCAFDAEMRKELANWLSGDVAAGGKGLAPEIAKTRALRLQVFMEGLAVRAVREPNLEPATVRAAIEEFLVGILSA